MNRAALRRRLEAITALVRPANSLAARLEALTPEQREAYDRWTVYRAKWRRHHPGHLAYDQTINGNPGPQLHRDIANILFDVTPVITVDMTDADISNLYGEYLKGNSRV